MVLAFRHFFHYHTPWTQTLPIPQRQNVHAVCTDVMSTGQRSGDVRITVKWLHTGRAHSCLWQFVS